MNALRTSSSFDLARLRQHFLAGHFTAEALIGEVIARIAAAGDDRVWITRVPEAGLRARAAALDQRAAREPGLVARLPLFGIPFAVKDNIDVAGLETTAACPASAYSAAISAPVVARLEEAGAILVGKTNMDQFATGLVGCRSPYGVPRNPFDPGFIPGGSSSGSAVAVASGLVSFALGTDTAGSGRVPAAFNNIVGMKPTRGLVSVRGVVPACRSIDCVSIFALSCGDAGRVFEVAAGYDAEDPFSRRPLPKVEFPEDQFRFGVPPAAALEFYGDIQNPKLFAAAATALEAIGGLRIEADLAPFRAAGAMLYDGPWLAERLVSVEELIGRQLEGLLPVIRQIITGGNDYTAADAFKAGYRLAILRRETERLWGRADVLLLPTAPAIYTVSEIETEPLALNARLGHYTNFVNLLDLAAVAVPTGFRSEGLPFGVSLIAPRGSDRTLLKLGARLQRRLDLPLGATRNFLAE
jgi:allophanate hydrolase